MTSPRYHLLLYPTSSRPLEPPESEGFCIHTECCSALSCYGPGTQETLVRRVRENAARLKELDPGLNAQIEAIQRMKGEDGALNGSLEVLLRDRDAMLSRLGIEDEVGSGDHGEGEEGEKWGRGSSFSGDQARVLVREREERAAELKMEKEGLENRCRDLQVPA